MKSKSFDMTCSPTGKQNLNKTWDFVGLYKSAAETSKLVEKRKSGDVPNKETPKTKGGSANRDRSPNKSKKKSKLERVDVSQIHIDGATLDGTFGGSSPVTSARVTSTPKNASAKGHAHSSKVKSIMKSNISTDHSINVTHNETIHVTKPKKRNKSVSFILEDQEEVAIKKTKSEETLKVNKSEKKTKIKDRKKHVKKSKNLSGKENKAAAVNIDNMDVESPNAITEKKITQVHVTKKLLSETPSGTTATIPAPEMAAQEKKKKVKKAKKHKANPNPETVELEKNNKEATAETKIKKNKKKKRHLKPTETEGEPALKNRKEDKPDIVEDLESLSIGDNAHTLTNLLDEMTVVDKDKRKKLKQKSKKTKKPKSTETGESEKSEEEKEKIKWKRRKWNRDKKGDINDETLSTSVIVENLPLGIMFNYKKLLTDHFVKYGLIKNIGIAEVYPTEESKPVFTTTICFYSDGAVELALELNNSEFEGSRIRVKRPLPATETTLVVRSYAELNDQALSSAFVGAGKIRSIRHMVKGKKSMATAFVEFDGPQSVERALKMAANAKIGGKKMHMAKFEVRTKKSRDKKLKGDGDSAVDADSEDSND